MTRKKKSHCEKPPSPCCERETRESECECIERTPVGYVTERNRFFTGKFMTARDFRAEQEYFLRRRWLQNRLFHGWGIACGLGVKFHEDERCRGWIKVQRGIAIDCHGREIILECDKSVKIPCREEPPRDPCEGKRPPKCDDDETGEPEQRPEDPRQEQCEPGQQQQTQQQAIQTNDADERCDDDHTMNGDGKEPDGYLVCIRYCEVETEKVPALYADGACDPHVEEANRIRERAVIEILPLPHRDITPQCWGHDDCAPHHHGHGIDWQQGAQEQEEPPKCHDEKQEPPNCEPCKDTAPDPCADPCGPFCPCGSWVPLARIVPGCPPWIDLSGRRDLMQAKTCLTKIVRTNWRHGGILDPRRQSELRIRFSQPVRPSNGPGDGVNRHTFTLRRRHVGYNMEEVDLPAGVEPRLENGNREAVFPLGRLFHAHMDKFFGAHVYIRLRCDFIVDEAGHAVDGDFLGGTLPSGNDHPGGAFESWVRIPDRGEVQK